MAVSEMRAIELHQARGETCLSYLAYVGEMQKRSYCE